jgi:membrane associated rhomboid family serine protease
MNDFLHTIKNSFKQGTAEIQLIYINLAVFLLVKLTEIVLVLFNISFDFITPYLAAPADLTKLLSRLWTVITYMFFHTGIFHIFFNMICLYWFGKLFLISFSGKQLSALYLFGGVLGAVTYILAYNIFPYFSTQVSSSLLMGASGAIMAIVVAAAMQCPNMKLQLLFVGGIKLKYIAGAVLLVSIFGITSSNAGGEFAHLGGALAGYVFIVSLRKGTDPTKGLNRFLDAVANLFKKGRKTKKQQPFHAQKMSDAEWNVQKAKNREEIDRILDKIKTSGYESLTAGEKKRLFDQSKK